MKPLPLILIATSLVAFGTTFSLSNAEVSKAQAPATAHDAKPAPRPDADHGRYLVHHVAMCIQCHTPRDANGHLIEAKLLRGEAVPVASPFKDVHWAFRAPYIAGLPGYTQEQAVHLLMTGNKANGGSPLSPMPPFRMSRADAEDVVAYLSALE